MSKADQHSTPEVTPPPPPMPRRKEPTIELDEADLIEVGDLLIEPSIVVPPTPPSNDAERVFFNWTTDSLVPISARSLADSAERQTVLARPRLRRRPRGKTGQPNA